MQVSHVVASTMTRPADTTAYAQGDLVANSTTAGSVTPFSFVIPWKRSCVIRGVSIKKSGTTATNATFKVHIFKDSPTVANGDNGAISTSYSNKIGVIAPGIMTAHTDSSSTTGYSGNFYVDTDTDRTLYALLEADAAYTPASAETFIVTLIIEQTQ
jgi:hypothetical protein